jgi:ribosomal protein S30
MYLMEIRKQAPVLPCRDQIRILSPKTRNRVRYMDLIAEVEGYESTFKQEALSAA